MPEPKYELWVLDVYFDLVAVEDSRLSVAAVKSVHAGTYF